MLIHNATFMVEPQKGAEFLEWFAPLARKASSGERARLSVLRNAGKAMYTESDMLDFDDSQPLSVAFQCEFDSMKELNEWREKRLRPLTAAFEQRYAPDAMVFTSVFEQIF